MNYFNLVCDVFLYIIMKTFILVSLVRFNVIFIVYSEYTIGEKSI